MIAPEAAPISFTTNSFANNPYQVIFLGVFFGMTLMFFGIMLGVPIIISMMLLFSGIGLSYGYGIGKVQYSITQLGIEQKIRRFIPYALKRKEETRLIAWDKISFFKNDTDKKRYGGEYEFIKLYLKTAPGEIWITDEQDKAGFQKFKEVFFLMVDDLKEQHAKKTPTVFSKHPASEKYNSLNENNVRQKSVPLPNASEAPPIRQRKSFYETLFAKALTMFFTLLTVMLIWIISYKGMHITNWFKLMFIILPGTVYLLYRVFFSPNKNEENNQRYQQ